MLGILRLFPRAAQSLLDRDPEVSPWFCIRCCRGTAGTFVLTSILPGADKHGQGNSRTSGAEGQPCGWTTCQAGAGALEEGQAVLICENTHGPSRVASVARNIRSP